MLLVVSDLTIQAWLLRSESALDHGVSALVLSARSRLETSFR